jgi:hypothetical protein
VPASEPASEVRPARDQRAPRLEPVHCDAAAADCRSATGTIIYVEAVDPDGDGDAHFVLSDGAGITAPGISVVDVARDLRPRRLPRIGDALSAVGPVYRGSFGQRQIQATGLSFARR